MEVDFPGGRRTSSFQQHIQNPIAARRQLVVGHSGLSNTVHTGYSARGGTTKKLALYPIFLLIRTPSHTSECWHYIRFGTISDGTTNDMYCTP